MTAQTTRTTKTGRRRGGSTNLVHVIQELEAAGWTSESMTAEQKIRAILDAAAQAMHHTAQTKYTKIRKAGRWYLGNLDQAHEARRQRKLLDQAAQYLDHAGDTIAAVILRDQEILDRARKPGKATTYDPSK